MGNVAQYIFSPPTWLFKGRGKISMAVTRRCESPHKEMEWKWTEAFFQYLRESFVSKLLSLRSSRVSMMSLFVFCSVALQWRDNSPMWYSSWSSWTNKGGIAKIIEIYYRIYRVWKLEEYSPSEERDLDATRPSVRPRCYKASLQGSFIKAEIR